VDILVVEDDPSIGMLFVQFLTRFGFQPEWVSNAEDAWFRYQQKVFPMCVLDWMLPGTSGLELCQRIRSADNGQHVYIWMITARNSKNDLLEVLAAGANDYLAKPLDLGLLEVRMRIAVEQIRILAQRRKAEKELLRYQAQLKELVSDRTQALAQSVKQLENEVQQRIQAETEVREARDQLRALSAHLIHIQEEQQKRIAREIHDELGQAMTALKLDLSWLRQQLEPHQTPMQHKIDKMLPLVSDNIQTIQRICTELRPSLLDDLGLEVALEWLLTEFQERTGLQCQLSIEPEQLELSADLAMTLFRICQESLTNIMRHAQASQVKIQLVQEADMIQLVIKDNGVGITSQQVEHPSSLGLLGIRERALPWQGKVRISGQPGQGTEIRVNLIWQQEEEHSHD